METKPLICPAVGERVKEKIAVVERDEQRNPVDHRACDEIEIAGIRENPIGPWHETSASLLVAGNIDEPVPEVKTAVVREMGRFIASAATKGTVGARAVRQ
jgi:hypothetical protein